MAFATFLAFLSLFNGLEKEIGKSNFRCKIYLSSLFCDIMLLQKHEMQKMQLTVYNSGFCYDKNKQNETFLAG